MAIIKNGSSCREFGRIVFDYFDVGFHNMPGSPRRSFIIQPGTLYDIYLRNYTHHDRDPWVDLPVAYDDCSKKSKSRPGNVGYLYSIMSEPPSQ
jgi:hypothetical protein